MAAFQTRALPQAKAAAQLVGAAFFWSLAGLLIKSVAWPPMAVAGGRGAVAAAFLLITHRGLKFRLSADLLVGAAAYAGCTAAFCVATKLTTAANAIVLQYTAPVWIGLFGAWLLGERTTRFDWVIIGIVLSGMALFFKNGLSAGTALGNALAVLSGIFFAAMTLALRKQKDGSPIESIILGNLLAFALGLPWIVGAPALPASGWLVLATLGTVQLGVSYLLYARAIKHVTALEAVLIPVIEPILNPIWVFLVIGERPTPWSLAGAVIVLSAVTVRATLMIRRGRPPLMPAAVA